MPSLTVCAAALRRAELLFAKRENASGAREAAYTLLNDDGGAFDGGDLLRRCLVAMNDDPFGALGVEPSQSDDSTLKRAFRRLALRLHPDKNKKTTALFQAVKAAFDSLLQLSEAQRSSQADQTGKRRDQQQRKKKSDGHQRQRAEERAAEIKRAQDAARERRRRYERFALAREERRRRAEEAEDEMLRGGAAERANARRAARDEVTPPISVVRGLRALAVSPKIVQVSWDEGKTASYELQWRTTGGWSAGARVGSRVVRKKNLQPATTYEFRVRQVGGEWTSPVSATTKTALGLTINSEADLFKQQRRRKPGPPPSKNPPAALSWHELYDEDRSCVFYWNSVTDESTWEPPSKWLEQLDPLSGVNYFTDGLNATWRRPSDFLPVVKRAIPTTTLKRRGAEKTADECNRMKVTSRARKPRGAPPSHN